MKFDYFSLNLKVEKNDRKCLMLNEGNVYSSFAQIISFDPYLPFFLNISFKKNLLMKANEGQFVQQQSYSLHFIS